MKRLAPLRALLAAVVAVDLLSFVFYVAEAREAAIGAGRALSPALETWSSVLACGSIAAAGILAAAAFARAPGRLWQGAVALCGLAALSTVHARLFGSPWRHMYYSGLCLLGWLLGLLVARRRGQPLDESYACQGSIALLGAAYFNAGISKLVYGGLPWLSGVPIQAVVVAQDGLVADDLLGSYRVWVSSTPAVAAFFSSATVLFELAGPLMLLGRQARACVALGLLAMHANIYALTHILYWQSLVFLSAFAAAPRQPPAPEPADDPALLRPRTFAAVAALLAAGACLAVAHQHQRWARDEARRRAHSPQPVHSPATVPSPSPRYAQSVGPFAVGQVLAETWSLDSITLSDTGFIAAFADGSRRVAFEVTCAASPYRSPFDLAPARIFYSSALAFADLEGLGRAFQARVRQSGAAGAEICDRIERWRAAAAPAKAP